MADFVETTPGPSRYSSSGPQGGAGTEEAALHSRRQLATFLEQIQTAQSGADADSWQLSATLRAPKPHFNVWKQFDEGTGLYRLRMSGIIPATVTTAAEVLNAWEVRKLWDKTMVEQEVFPLDSSAGAGAAEDSEEVQAAAFSGDEDEDEDAHFITEESLVYIQVKSPPGVKNRDFSHRRILRRDKRSGGVQVVDVSIEDERAPVRPKCVRANTIFSGAVIKPHAENPKHTFYETITHVDICGDIPKAIINALAAKATVSWWKTLCEACAKHENGNLKKK